MGSRNQLVMRTGATRAGRSPWEGNVPAASGRASASLVAAGWARALHSPPSPAELPAAARAQEFGGLAGSNPPRRSRELTFPSRACGAAADLHPCHHGAGAIVTWLGLGEASSHGEPSSTLLQPSRCTGHKPGTGTVGRSARAQAHPRMAALLLKTFWASGFLHHLHGGEEMREKHRLG